MDAFIKAYLERLSDREAYVPIFSKSPNTSKRYIISESITETIKGQKGTKSPEKIKCKSLYLIDAIIRESLRLSPDGMKKECPLNASILHSVIGKDYKVLIDTLHELGYLELGGYEIGKHSQLYILPEHLEYDTIEVINKRIFDYKQKTLSLISKFKEENTYSHIDRIFGDGFVKNYLSSLNLIKIEDKKGFNEYEKKRIKENPSSYIYYRYVYNELCSSTKVIDKIDAYSGAFRIYHILTNLKRELKSFLNIEFSLDASNSQPLLFNLLIFDYFNIDYISSYNLLSFLNKNNVDISKYHYDCKKLRKYLKTNYIEFSSFADIKSDVIWYLYLTSTGQLWDWLSDRTGVERDELKTGMFAQVFYTNKVQVFKNQKLAILFSEHFPTVMRLIKRWKKTPIPDDIKSYIEQNKIYPKSENGALAIAMQQKESMLMGAILKRLYKKGWKALNIHDCIIIPKSRGKQPSREEVLTIMNDVYQSFGLVATFK